MDGKLQTVVKIVIGIVMVMAMVIGFPIQTAVTEFQITEKELKRNLDLRLRKVIFPTLGGGSASNVTQKKPQNTLNYSNAINEDIEKHKKNKPPPPKKFVSLVSLKKKKKDDEFVFEEDFEREEEYVETTYFTEDEEEYYEDEEELRRAEQDYDY